MFSPFKIAQYFKPILKAGLEDTLVHYVTRQNVKIDLDLVRSNVIKREEYP